MYKFFMLLLFYTFFSFSYSKPILKFALTVPKDTKASKITEKLIQSIFSQLNYDTSFYYFPVERCSQMLLSDEIDGLPAKPVEELVNFPNIPVVKEPFLNTPFKVYYKNEILKTLSWNELEKYKCVNIIGIQFVNKMMPNATKNKTLYSVPTYEQALKMLQSGRVSFAILIEPIADNVISKKNITGLKKSNTLIATTPVYLLLSKKNKELAPKATEVLKQMKKDGSYYKILEEFK